MSSRAFFFALRQAGFITVHFPPLQPDEAAAGAKRAKTLADYFPSTQPMQLNYLLEVSVRTKGRDEEGKDIDLFMLKSAMFFAGPHEPQSGAAREPVHDTDRPALAAICRVAVENSEFQRVGSRSSSIGF